MEGSAAIPINRLYAIGRLVLPAMGGFLAVVGLLLAHAQAQSAGGDAFDKGKVRILAVGAPPLVDEQLPDGGVVMALVNASLGRAGSGAASQGSVKWTRDALTPQLLKDPSIDLSLPVESADCDNPNNLTHSSAALCDSAFFSEPILQVVLSLFTSSNSSFKFDTDQSIFGKTVCLSRDHDLSVLNGNGRNWASQKRVTVVRRATLLDCVAAVQANDADTFVAIDLEGTHLLRRLGLAPYFTLLPRPLAMASIHAIVSREHARGPDLIAALNTGLKKLKEGDTYASIVQKHLIAAASAPVAGASAQSKAALAATAAAAPPEVAPKAPATSAATPPASPAKAAVATVPPPAAAAPAAPAPAAPAAPNAAVFAPPPTDKESRERALKFVKRGGEELAEGRVAPARLLFERAAEMGLPQAAMALAATYDAVELNQPHLRNVLPDPAEARRWYERAQALGAAEAGARLQRLGAK